VKPILVGLVFLTAAGAQPALFEGHTDVGITPKQGSFETGPNGSFRVTGGGANIWAEKDAFHFAWKRLSGDAVITAEVQFIGTGTVAHRKAVLMFRQDLSPEAAYADVALHGDGLASLQFRPTPGAATQEIRSAVTGPVRLRIERRGNQFTMSVGSPGGALTASAPATVELKDPVYVGIGVCSHDESILETAVFSNVQIAPPAQRYRSKISIFDMKTKATRVLYTADNVFEAPNWSRDGKYLLVNSGGNLYRLAVNGGANVTPEKVGLPPGYVCNNDHDFSPDGKLIAFSASSANSRQSQVYVAAADGSNVKLLTPAAPSYFHGWSPDGKWLAFVGQRNGKFELYRVPVTGGAEERLTFKGANDDGPDYSRDGKWIYFNSDRSGGWDIWRMPASGAGQNDVHAEQITRDDLQDWFPHPSPDGKQLLFFSFPKGTEGHNGRMEGAQLRIMPMPGSKPQAGAIQVLTTFFGGQGTINVNSWSPDSKQFAFVNFEPLK
jgi:sugar lactone lactonase YvrE